MKLIIEKEDDKLFVYTETNRQYIRVKKARSKLPIILQKEAIEILGEECWLEHNNRLQEDFYMVFNIKE